MTSVLAPRDTTSLPWDSLLLPPGTSVRPRAPLAGSVLDMMKRLLCAVHAIRHKHVDSLVCVDMWELVSVGIYQCQRATLLVPRFHVLFTVLHGCDFQVKLFTLLLHISLHIILLCFETSVPKIAESWMKMLARLCPLPRKRTNSKLSPTTCAQLYIWQMVASSRQFAQMYGCAQVEAFADQRSGHLQHCRGHPQVIFRSHWPHSRDRSSAGQTNSRRKCSFVLWRMCATCNDAIANPNR